MDPLGRLDPDSAIRSAVSRLRAGVDTAACLRTLDDRLRPGLLRYFRRPPFTREDAEDLVQKTLSAVYHHVGSLQHEERFFPWLFAIARNVRVTERERRQQEVRVVAGGLDDVPEAANCSDGGQTDSDLERAERLRSVTRAIGSLPARQRQCLVLRVRDDMPYKDIAEVLGLDPLTVRNHIAEARKALRRQLGETTETRHGR